MALWCGAAAQADRTIEQIGSFLGSVEAIHVDPATNLAYISSGQRLVILDVTDAGNLIELGSLTFEGVTFYDIVVRDGLAYIGGFNVKDSVGNEAQWLGVVDVSDPTSPTVVAGVHTSNGRHRVLAIDDAGQTLYTSDPMGGLAQSFDISDPRNPVFQAYIVAPHAGVIRGNHWYGALADSSGLLVSSCEITAPGVCINVVYLAVSDVAHVSDLGVAMHGDHLYVSAKFRVAARTIWYSQLFVADFSDPTAPVHVGTWANDPNDLDILGGGVSMAASEGRLYWAFGGDSNWNRTDVEPPRRNLLIFDIATNPASPALIGTYSSAGRFEEIEVVGSTVYLGDQREGLVILDCSDPANPVRVGGYYSPSVLRGFAKVGDMLYVSDRRYGITALDVSAPAAPVLAGKWESGDDRNWGIDARDNLVYLAAGWSGLQIVDFADPANPSLVGAFPFPAGRRATALELNGNIAQVSGTGGGSGGWLWNLDISDPANILGRGFLDTGLPPENMSTRAADDVVFTSNILQFKVIDNADPDAPVLLWQDTTDTKDLVVDGPLLYVADENALPGDGSSLAVFDVSDLTVPPVKLGFIEVPGDTAGSLAVQGSLVFLCNARGPGDVVLRMIDVSDPSAPALLDTAPASAYGYHDVLADLPYVYALSGEGYGHYGPGVVVHRVFDTALPALAAPAPHDVAKNRYVSFSPNNAGVYAAFRIDLSQSADFPDSIGTLGWVGEPDAGGRSTVVDAPFFSDGWPSIVHVGDCGIVPVAAYEIRASGDGTSLSEPLSVATIARPEPSRWADVVGTFEGGWTAPNGVVNFADISATVKAFQVDPTAPHITWADIDPQTPNGIANFADIGLIVQGFQGQEYPFGAPSACP